MLHGQDINARMPIKIFLNSYDDIWTDMLKDQCLCLAIPNVARDRFRQGSGRLETKITHRKSKVKRWTVGQSQHLGDDGLPS